MKKARVQISRRRYRGVAHGLARRPAVIAAMRHDMQQYLFAAHHAPVAIGEHKSHLLLKKRFRQGVDVSHKPGVRLFHRRREIAQAWRFLGIRRRVIVRAAREVSFEDAVHHVDVIQNPNGCVGLSRMLLDINCRKRREKFVVRPRLVAEQRVQRA